MTDRTGSDPIASPPAPRPAATLSAVAPRRARWGDRLVLPVALLLALAATLGTGVARPEAARAAASFVAAGTQATSTTGSLTVSPPAGLAGDLLIAQIAFNDGTNATLQAIPGWTLLRRTDNGTNMGVATWWRIATGTTSATDQAVLSWTSGTRRASGAILRYRGVEPIAPTPTGSGTGSGSALTAPAVTTTVASSIVVWLFATDNQYTIGGLTAPIRLNPAGPSNGPSIAAVDATIAAPGTSGTRTATTTSNTPWAAQTLVLAPDLAPVLTVAKGAAQPDPTNLTPITFTIGASETVTGLAAEDLVVGGTATGFSVASLTGSGTAYTVTLNGDPVTSGTVTLAVNAGAVTDANGNANAASNVASVSFSALPTGSVSIAAGAAAVPGRDVTLSITGQGSNGGVTTMRLSNDGTTWGAWIPFAATTAWTLADGADGPRTVSLELRDGAGNISSPPITDGVILDRAAPVLAFQAPTEEANVFAGTFAPSWTVTDVDELIAPGRPGTVIRQWVALVDGDCGTVWTADGVATSGNATTLTADRCYRWTADPALAAGALAPRDRAGNITSSGLTSAILTTDLSPIDTTSSALPPTVGANVASGAGCAWAGTGNAGTDDTAYATCAVNGTDLGNTTSQLLALRGFGFAVPQDATIVGVTATVLRFASNNTSLADAAVRLTKDGSTPVGSDLRVATQWTTTATTITYGGTANLWGTTLTPAEVNSAGFGLLLSVSNVNRSVRTASVDLVTISVTYRLTGGPVLTLERSGSAATNASPVLFRLSADRNILRSSVRASDVQVTNGSVSAISCSGAACTFSVIPGGEGSVTIAPSATFQIRDSAGNASTTAGGTARSITYDLTPPTLTWSAPAAGLTRNPGSYVPAWTVADALSGVGSAGTVVRQSAALVAGVCATAWTNEAIATSTAATTLGGTRCYRWTADPAITTAATGAFAAVKPVDAAGNPVPLAGLTSPIVIVEPFSTTTSVARTTGSGAIAYGDPVSFTASVTPTAGRTIPAGTITFRDGETAIGTCNAPVGAGVGLASSCAITVASGGLLPGTRVITASWAGTADDGSSLSATLDQEVLPLYVSATVTVSTKTYDGTTEGTVDTCELIGTVPGDELSCDPSSATASFGNPAPGVWTVVVTGLELTGPKANLYGISGPVTTTGTIVRKRLTATATVNARAYNGTTAATIRGCNLIGVASRNGVPDEVTCGTLTATAAFATKDVGTWDAIITGLTLQGAATDYYTFGGVVLTSGQILRRAVNVSVTAADKVYDGTTATTVSACTIISGVLLAEQPDISCVVDSTSASFDRTTAGTGITVYAPGLSLVGTGSSNYGFAVSPPTGTATITRRPLSAAITASGKVYSGTTTATITGCNLVGVLGTDSVFCSTSSASANFASKDVGTHVVNATGLTVTGTMAGSYSLAGTASTSATITIASSSTGQTASPSTPEVGDTLAASATVTGPPTVTGTVTFTLYAGSGCTGNVVSSEVRPVASGSAATSTGFPVTTSGTYSRKAVYSGDINHTGSSSSCLDLSVDKDTTSTTVAPDDASIYLGDRVVFTVTVNPATSAGTAEVWLGSRPGGTQLGSCTVASGSCTVATTSLPVGSQTIRAYFSGAQHKASDGSTSVTVDWPPIYRVDVTANATETVGAPAYYGSPRVRLTAGGSGATVSFTATVNPASTPATIPFIVAQDLRIHDISAIGSPGPFIVCLPGSGTDRLWHWTGSAWSDITWAGGLDPAAWPGEVCGQSATLSPFTAAPAKTATTVAFGASLTTADFGQTVEVTGSVTPSTATGTLRFISDTTTLGTCALAAGSCRLDLSELGIGTWPITVRYLGDADYAASDASGTVILTVTKTTTKTVIRSNKARIRVGRPVTFRVTVSSPTGLIPTGGVTIRRGSATGKVVGTCPLLAGTCTVTTSRLPAATQTIVALYPGSATFKSSSGSTSQVVLSSVSIPPASLAVSASVPALPGDPFVLAGTIAGSATCRADRPVTFRVDLDGDGIAETLAGRARTDAAGHATLAWGPAAPLPATLVVEGSAGPRGACGTPIAIALIPLPG